MAWKILDSRGNTRVLSECEVEELRRQTYKVYDACERHNVICSGKKAYVSHLQKEHAY